MSGVMQQGIPNVSNLADPKLPIMPMGNDDQIQGWRALAFNKISRILPTAAPGYTTDIGPLISGYEITKAANAQGEPGCFVHPRGTDPRQGLFIGYRQALELNGVPVTGMSPEVLGGVGQLLSRIIYMEPAREPIPARRADFPVPPGPYLNLQAIFPNGRSAQFYVTGAQELKQNHQLGLLDRSPVDGTAMVETPVEDAEHRYWGGQADGYKPGSSQIRDQMPGKTEDDIYAQKNPYAATFFKPGGWPITDDELMARGWPVARTNPDSRNPYLPKPTGQAAPERNAPSRGPKL